MKIAHFADVHYRGLSRHAEYKKIFGRFFDSEEAKSVDLIFVAGDIFHTKTQGISPEYVDELGELLRKMSSVAPVLLMLGNHDGNLSNFTRNDAVSPIVDLINDDRITLLKQSGTKDYEKDVRVRFHVYSLFDKSGWLRMKPSADPDVIDIAAFHGPVSGCKSESGMLLGGEVDVKYFSGYDYVMLGDIHKRQFLTSDNKIAYPGSTIQQNYSEDVGHGYLLWDVRGKNDFDVKFVELLDEHPFVTVKHEFDVADTINKLSQFPTQSRVRVACDRHLTAQEMKTISSLIRTKMSPLEITFKNGETEKLTVSDVGNSLFVKKSYRDVDTLSLLVAGYIGDAEVEKDPITKQILTECISDIPQSGSDVTRGVTWSLKRIEFDNTYAYGENNYVDFSAINGLYGVFAPNRAGKSSILGTILYCLYNSSDRGNSKNIDTINVRKDWCNTKCQIVVQDDTYEIERRTEKVYSKKGLAGAPTTLNVTKTKKDGTKEELKGEQRTDTDKYLKSVIGTYEDFITTCVSTQGSLFKVVDDGSTRRRDYVAKFLDLEFFDRLLEACKNRLTSLRSKIGNYDRDKTTSAITSTSDTIENLKLTIDQKDLELKNARIRLQELSSVSFVSENDVKAAKSVVNSLRVKIDGLTETLAHVQRSISDENEKLEKMRNVTKNFSSSSDEFSVFESMRAAEKKVGESKSKLSILQKNMTTSEAAAKVIDSVPCHGDGMYSSCAFLAEKVEAVSKLSSIAEQIVRENTSLTESIESVKKLEETVSVLKKLQVVKKAISESENKLVGLRAQETNVDAAIVTEKAKLEAATERHRFLLASIDENASNEKTSAEIRVDALNSAIKDLQYSLGKKHAELESLVDSFEAKDSLIEQIVRAEQICKAFGKKAIPAIILREYLPVINAEISDVLSSVVDFSVELDSDEETNSLEVYINYGDSRRLLDMGSGMEKTMSALAIRTALHTVSTLPKSDIMIIDEGFGTLDAAGIEACVRLLKQLSEKFKSVIVITHVEELKDAVDGMIGIGKKEKDSYVRYPLRASVKGTLDLVLQEERRKQRRR